MRIKKLSFENFKGFEGTHEIEFNNSVTAIIGVNGAGKTSVLDAIGMTLETIPTGDFYMHEMTKLISSISIGYKEANVKCDIKLKNIQNDIGINIKNTNSFPISTTQDVFHRIIEEEIKKNKPIPILQFFQTHRNFQGEGLQNYNISVNTQIRRSDTYKNAFDPNINYNQILTWYIQQINIENNEKVKRKDLDYQLPTVTAIKNAINKFLSHIGDSYLGNAQIDVSPESNNLVLFVNKRDKKLEFSQLSSGEKMMIGMVLDIAYRMSIANPMLENPLESTGIILIDELELHLHPKWQSTVLGALSTTFPNVQFIVTTHSPLVINHLKSDQLVILDDFKITQGKDVYNTYGRDVNSIIEDFMGGQERPSKIKDILSDIEKLIDENKIANAEKKLQALKSLIDPNDYKILELETIIEIEKDEID